MHASAHLPCITPWADQGEHKEPVEVRGRQHHRWVVCCRRGDWRFHGSNRLGGNAVSEVIANGRNAATNLLAE